jgi:hypothetical protein
MPAGLGRLVMIDGAGHYAHSQFPDRLGVRPPSLYKHVDGLADLQHRLATQAMTEFGEVLRDAVQGQAGRDARPRC